MTITEWLGVGSTLGLAGMSILKFMEARKKDAITAQSGANSNHRAGTQQILDGFNLLLERAQETIEDDRDVIKLLEGRVDTLGARSDRFEALLETCKTENTRYRDKYGPLAS